MGIGEKLVVLRKEKGLTQLKLAEMMNVSRQAVSRWESGDTVPSTDNLKYLGDLYGVPLEYLLHDNAPELIHANLGLGKEKAVSVNEVKGKKRNIMLAFIATGIVLVVLCSIALRFYNKRGETIPMKEIEGSDVVIKNEFDLDW